MTMTPAPAIDRTLLVSRSGYLRGWRAVRLFALRAFFYMVALVTLMPFTWVRWTPAVAFVPFLAPFSYLIAFFPYFVRRKPEEVLRQRKPEAEAPSPQPMEQPALVGQAFPPAH